MAADETAGSARTEGLTMRKRKRSHEEDVQPKRRPSASSPSSSRNTATKLCHLLALSDDVLLMIMQFLDSISLLNLGETCLRLKGVTSDPNLWKTVDLTSVSSTISDCKRRLCHINQRTKIIKIKGFYVATSDLTLKPPPNLSADMIEVWRRNFDAFEYYNLFGKQLDIKKESISPDLMRIIASKCPQLRELCLLCCNVNANNLDLIDCLPSTLTSLSIVHCNFVNLDPQKSPFFKIHLAVPLIRILDISWNPQWVTNHSLGSLCKCESLTKLNLRGCKRMGELFAYTALAVRFGFRKLETLDLRDTSVGNSEVPCFGSLPVLTHLYLGHTTGHCTTYEPPPGSESDGQITDRGLYYFVNEDWSPTNKLQCLDLWNTKASSNMAQELAKRRHLKWVNFSGTGETADATGSHRTLLNMNDLKVHWSIS